MYERAFKSIGLKVTLLNAYKIKKLLYKNFLEIMEFIIFKIIRKKIIKNIKKKKI